MALKLITPPANQPISLLEAKEHLRLDLGESTDDMLIAALIVAATEYCENFSNRRYVTQTWDYFADEFSEDAEIPLPPLQHIVFVKYKDSGGVVQTVSFMDPSGSPVFEDDNYIVDIASEPGRLVKKTGAPTVTKQTNALQIRFVCGYGAGPNLYGLGGEIPERYRAAIKLKLTDLYEHRGDDGAKDEDRVEGILWQDRVIPMP